MCREPYNFEFMTNISICDSLEIPLSLANREIPVVKISDILGAYKLNSLQESTILSFINSDVAFKHGIFQRHGNCYVNVSHLLILTSVTNQYLKFNELDISDNAVSIENLLLQKINKFIDDEKSKNTKFGALCEHQKYYPCNLDVSDRLLSFLGEGTEYRIVEILNGLNSKIDSLNSKVDSLESNVKELKLQNENLLQENKKLREETNRKKTVTSSKASYNVCCKDNSKSKDEGNADMVVDDIFSHIEHYKSLIMKSGKFKSLWGLNSKIFDIMENEYKIFWDNHREELKSRALREDLNLPNKISKLEIIKHNHTLLKIYVEVLKKFYNECCSSTETSNDSSNGEEFEKKISRRDITSIKDKFELFSENEEITLGKYHYNSVTALKTLDEKVNKLALLINDKTTSKAHTFNLIYTHSSVRWSAYSKHYQELNNLPYKPTRKKIMASYILVFDQVITVLNTLISERTK